MEFAGLAFGILSTWKTCVQVFDIVVQSREYAKDFETCRIKLEVERIRLMAWGDAIGLNGTPDERLQGHCLQVVLQVLGGIQHIFENSDALRNKYGLIEQSSPELQGKLPLWLRKASAGFKKASTQRQRASTVRLKTLWVIHDRTKFLKMVTDVRDFNDSLRDLFPDLGIRDALRRELQARNVTDLSLLSSAADQRDVSDVASEVLEAKTETVASEFGSARSETTIVARRQASSHLLTLDTIGDDEEASANVEERFKTLDEFMDKLNAGALCVNLMGPYHYSPKTRAIASWTGHSSEGDTYNVAKRKGFVRAQHEALKGYHKPKYIPGKDSNENNVLLFVESNPDYENNNTGTVTLEGFALECWEYAKLFGPVIRTTTTVVTGSAPVIGLERLLRRLHELKNPGLLGSDTTKIRLELQDFLCLMSWRVMSRGRERDEIEDIRDLYNTLNREDLVVDFIRHIAVTANWRTQTGLCKMLWQIILGKELERRLKNFPSLAYMDGLTEEVLATVIISEQWVNNVTITHRPNQIPNMYKSTTDVAKAKTLESQADRASVASDHARAIELYTEALGQNGTNVACICKRAAVQLARRDYSTVLYQTFIAIELNPTCKEAWVLRGAAYSALGNFDGAANCFECAIENGDTTAATKENLAAAEKAGKVFDAKVDATTDRSERHYLVGNYLDKAWLTRFQDIQFHSNVYERQVDGLIFFAEQLKWPHMTELRGNAEGLYSSLRNGKSMAVSTVDWLFGLSLPGQHFAYKIMATTIRCSSLDLNFDHLYVGSLVLPTQSYWRTTSALGRVLGGLPNLRSICGWLGPCPAVETDIPINKAASIRLNARRVSPTKPADTNTSVIYIGGGKGRYEHTKPADDEVLEDYFTEMTSEENYFAPQPPVKSMSIASLSRIKLDQVGLNGDKVEEAEYRATLTFSIDGNEVNYTLWTNPIFSTIPACVRGPHRLQKREMKAYNTTSIDVSLLKSTLEVDDTLLINATGTGADVLARAWCCENGKNAIVVRSGGTCLVCTLKAASSLDIPVIIWAG